jgi:hypothetical protein
VVLRVPREPNMPLRSCSFAFDGVASAQSKQAECNDNGRTMEYKEYRIEAEEKDGLRQSAVWTGWTSGAELAGIVATGPGQEL